MNYDKLIKMRNETNIFAKNLGICITKIELGKAEAELKITDGMSNFVGSVHGGCLFTLADVVAGSVASSYGYKSTTVDANMHYLNPALDTTTVYGKGEVLKHGKKITVVNVTITDQKGVTLVSSIFTFMSLGIPIELD